MSVRFCATFAWTADAMLPRIGDGDLVAGHSEDLRNTMAHQAGADHRYFCFFCHCSSHVVPAPPDMHPGRGYFVLHPGLRSPRSECPGIPAV